MVAMKQYHHGETILGLTSLYSDDDDGAFKKQVQECGNVYEHTVLISQVKDSVSIPASSLPVSHYVLGTRSNIKSKDRYHFLDDRVKMDKYLKSLKAKLVYRRPAKKPATKPLGQYIVVYKKTVFVDGKTQKGETLEQLAKRHTRQFDGKMGRVLGIINGYSASFKPEAVEKLKKQPEVKYIEKDGPVGIN